MAVEAEKIAEFVVSLGPGYVLETTALEVVVSVPSQTIGPFETPAIPGFVVPGTPPLDAPRIELLRGPPEAETPGVPSQRIERVIGKDPGPFCIDVPWFVAVVWPLGGEPGDDGGITIVDTRPVTEVLAGSNQGCPAPE